MLLVQSKIITVQPSFENLIGVVESGYCCQFRARKGCEWVKVEVVCCVPGSVSY